jgi:hypothetical protein
MTEILFAGVGLFFCTVLAQTFIEAPRWVWKLVELIGGTIFVLVIDPGVWYLAPAVAGVSLLLSRLEDLLMTKADEARFNIMNRR